MNDTPRRPIALNADELNWLHIALGGRPVWGIGQLTAPTTRALNSLARMGLLEKSRVSFMHISPLKSVWHRPGETPQ